MLENARSGLHLRYRRQVQSRTGRIDRHQLVDHGVAAGEAGELVATHWILRSVEQAFVAIGARSLGAIPTARPLPHEIVVGDERARDGDTIERARCESRANERGGLVTSGVKYRYGYVGLDGARLFQADAFDRQSLLHTEPYPPEDRPQQAVAKQQEIAECVHAGRDHGVVGGGDGLERKIARRVERMRKQRAGRDMDGVGTFALAPFRDLDGVREHVALLLPWDDVVAVHRAELDLQMEVAADARADRPDHF